MALIKCPECNKEISNKATTCIHCGYPLHEQTKNSYAVFFNGFSSEKLMIDNKAKVSGQIRQILGTDLRGALNVINSSSYRLADGIDKQKAEWISKLLTPYGCIIDIRESNSELNDFSLSHIDTSANATILCPHCGSSAVSTGQRGFSLLTGFIGSRKTTNRCGKCGWTWQP